MLTILFKRNPDYRLLGLLVKMHICLRVRNTHSIFIKRELRVFCKIEINAHRQRRSVMGEW